jgi:hypothetical protein
MRRREVRAGPQDGLCARAVQRWVRQASLMGVERESVARRMERTRRLPASRTHASPVRQM